MFTSQGFAEYQPMYQERVSPSGALRIKNMAEGVNPFCLFSAVLTYSNESVGHFNGTFGYWRPPVPLAGAVVKEGSLYRVYGSPGIPEDWMRNRHTLWMGTVIQDPGQTEIPDSGLCLYRWFTDHGKDRSVVRRFYSVLLSEDKTICYGGGSSESLDDLLSTVPKGFEAVEISGW